MQPHTRNTSLRNDRERKLGKERLKWSTGCRGYLNEMKSLETGFTNMQSKFFCCFLFRLMKKSYCLTIPVKFEEMFDAKKVIGSF